MRSRPAFYALSPGGWRDLVTLLHLPYTAWILSYVALGAAAAPTLHAERLLAALTAFALAVGVAAHALDELQGRPLQTHLSERALRWMAGVTLAAACAIGTAGALEVSPSLLGFVLVGAFLVAAYNLEWWGGRFHSDRWFALAWGGFPALTGFWVNALQMSLSAVLVTAACCAASVAQRRLSVPARQLRRRTTSVTGQQHMVNGRSIELSVARLASPLDGALAALSAAMPLLAGAMVAVRL